MEVKWTGPKKHVTGYGIFNKDDIKILPDNLAEDLIKEGLATATTKTNYEEKGKPPSIINRNRKKED